MKRRLDAELFLVSFAMLFAEIALIRWLSTEARIFAYVHNLVLLSCFLGIGLGCYYSRKRISPALTGFALGALVLMIRVPLTVTIQGQPLHVFKDVPLLLSAFTDSVVWYEPSLGSVLLTTGLGIVSTLLIFFVVLISFVSLGQLLGRALDDHPRTIAAYSINVLASVLGVWAFSGLSFVYAPPWVWFGIVVPLLAAVLLCRRSERLLDWVSLLVLAAAVVALGIPPRDEARIGTIWSPYQKLELLLEIDEVSDVQTGYRVNVNNVGYMVMLDLSDEFIESHPQILNLAERGLSQYDIPFTLKQGAGRALILGAGAGNDAAGALRHDIGHVDAVEIDPGIHRLGARYHPEGPYTDPRVRVMVDDARSFLKKAGETYDIVSFGLLDSHSLSSSYNNVRLDHYVYTLESFQEARRLLRDDGLMTVAFEAQRPWITRRLHDLLLEAFGFPPVMAKFDFGRYGWGGTLYITGVDQQAVQEAIRNHPAIERFLSRNPAPLPEDPEWQTVKLSSDDWPYLYLAGPHIPNMHLCVTAVLVVLFLATRRFVLTQSRIDLHFFFLGSAFLLLEFQNISKSALLFGSTWLVNSVVITAILILILLANMFVARTGIRNMRPVYGLLIASLLVIWLVPLSALNALGFGLKAAVGGIMLNLPVFFAGIIFIQSFKSTRSKNQAFGSNLLGAAFGGVLESLSFISGINLLVLLVIVLYALSWAFRGRSG